jgi:hypothetical protein
MDASHATLYTKSGVEPLPTSHNTLKVRDVIHSTDSTWSTGLIQTIQMTKSPLTRHGILLQTPMTKTFSRQSRLQPISAHIATHIATKTEPVTIFIKIDYCVVHRFEPAIVNSMEKCQ